MLHRRRDFFEQAFTPEAQRALYIGLCLLMITLCALLEFAAQERICMACAVAAACAMHG